jgi:DNA-binding transcriptional regulator PaaX
MRPAAHRLREWMFPERGQPAPGERVVVGSTARAVLLALNVHVNGAGVTWVSAPTIAVGLELSERTVREAFGRLERTGLISGEHRAGRATIWTVTPEAASGFG